MVGTNSRRPSSAGRSADLTSELEEVAGNGEYVLVVARTPGVDAYRVRPADDRNFTVFTVRDGRIVAIRDCRDRREALAAAGIQ